jgi:hypothetical protein
MAHLALALRELVLTEAPEAVEKAYQNHPSAIWFGFGPKMKDMFCHIAMAREILFEAKPGIFFRARST